MTIKQFLAHFNQVYIAVFHLRSLAYFASKKIASQFVIEGDFFNWVSPENVSRLAPQKTP